jgi:hypothetical protein
MLCSKFEFRHLSNGHWSKAVICAKGHYKHRKKHDREPLPGMMVHQDTSSHEWIRDHQRSSAMIFSQVEGMVHIHTHRHFVFDHS